MCKGKGPSTANVNQSMTHIIYPRSWKTKDRLHKNAKHFLQTFYSTFLFPRNTFCKKQSQQWFWLSWQSGRFLYQRSVVRIQIPANLYRIFIYCQLFCIEKTKRKSGREWAIFKNKQSQKALWLRIYFFASKRFGCSKISIFYLLVRLISWRHQLLLFLSSNFTSLLVPLKLCSTKAFYSLLVELFSRRRWRLISAQ